MTQDGDAARLAALLDVPALTAVEASQARIEAALADLRRSAPSTLVSVREAARIAGVSESTAWRRVRDGSWPTTRIGRSVRVDVAALRPATDDEVRRMASEATQDMPRRRPPTRRPRPTANDAQTPVPAHVDHAAEAGNATGPVPEATRPESSRFSRAAPVPTGPG